MPVRVLLVEDSDVYRSTLELLLAREDGIDVVGSVATGAEAVAVAASLQPDVALVDLRLPGRDGVDTIGALRDATPRTVVLCLTADATPEERAAALDAGAVAVLGKERPVRALAEAVRDASVQDDPA